MKFKKYSKILTIFIIVLILIIPVAILIFPNLNSYNSPPNFETQADDSDINAILWKFGQGLIGSGPTMQPRLVRFTEGGDQFIVIGMDGSIATITLNGLINMSYITFGEVIDFELIDDISGDFADDIVLITYDQEHPNVIAISSKDGKELWFFKPQVESIDLETFATQDFTPYTWDIEIVNDINEDGISDVVISSWYKLIVLDGKNGGELWVNEVDFTNDIWRIEILNNMIIAGSENGELIAINAKTGQKIWIYKVPPTKMPTRSPEGFLELDVPNSIDDILIINDVDNDNTNDLLITSDDGNIRLISGGSGVMLDKIVIYNITYIGPYMGWTMGWGPSTETSDSPYSSIKRLFRTSGVRLFEIPDLNDDGKGEYLVIATELEYIWSYMENRMINGTIFNVNGEKLEILETINYNWDPFTTSSFPAIVNIDSEIQLYLYVFRLPNLLPEESAGIYRVNIDDKNFTNLTLVYRDRDIDPHYGNKNTAFYISNIGDVNNDGIGDLFAFSKDGKYLLIDCKKDEIMWVRTLKRGESKLTEIRDVNGDSVNDLLYKKIKDFEPFWDDSIKEDGMISELLAINAKTGDIIWEFKVPSPQYYEGLRDVLNIGDINDDNIDDYVAWIIPSEIPDEIINIIKNISGNSFLNLNDKDREIAIYRALLSEYIRLVAIDGSNGSIFWNTSLIDFPYKFYREYGNQGNYTDPIGLYSNGGNFYLRRNNQLPNSWINNWNNILWENEWVPSTLLHADKIEIEFGEYISGNVFDLSDIEGNYTLKSRKQESVNLWKAVLNLTIPLDFSDEKRLGIIKFPLSQIERFSALKMQSSLLINDSSNSNWYNFTYEIYNESSNEWVICNWSGNIFWDLRYVDLHGNFKNSSSGGYRSNYKFFNLSTDYRRDDMYLITRGTYNRENGLCFDYENKTTLSDFMGSNKNINIRLNITNGKDPFELSINNFGIGAFYWGLFGNQYDRFYIYDYNLSLENYFSDVNLLNLEIQDFEIINGTNDKYLDVLTVIGMEVNNNSFSSRLRLFDIKNQKNFTKWSRNQTYLPNQKVNILPLNYSLNNWILSGTFFNGHNNYFAHKLVQNPHWNIQLSYFENYSDSKTVIDYQWSINSHIHEILGKTEITKDGKIGIILGNYDYSGSIRSIRIFDVITQKIVSQIDNYQLFSLTGGISTQSKDFSALGAGRKLLISYDDFNGDNYLDHVGYYLKKYTNRVGGYETAEIRIYSGNSSDGNFKILFKYTHPVTEFQKRRYFNLELEEGLKLPFTSIGDFNNDGISDGILGLQMGKVGLGMCYKNANLSYYDIYSSSENFSREFSENRWILEPFYCLLKTGAEPRITFFDFIENIGDFSGDGRDDVLVSRYLYSKDIYSVYMMTYSYSDKSILEILDPSNQKTIFRFNLNFDSFYTIDDLNGDGKKECVILFGGVLICVNSKFGVHFSNLEDGQTVKSSEFVIEWEGNGNYDYFEVVINDQLYKPTKSTNLFVSLGAGLKKITIFMYNKNGMVVAVDSVAIIVPTNFSFFILIFAITGILAGIFIVFYRIKKNREKLLIDIKPRKESEDLN